LDVETLVELAGRWVELVARETEARPIMLRLFRISRNLTDEQIEHLVERAFELGSNKS
jgi:hypothetical protein